MSSVEFHLQADRLRDLAVDHLDGHAYSVALSIAESISAAAALREQPEARGVALNVKQVGNYGAAYDTPGTCRAFTYDHQPGNVEASRLGGAAVTAANASAGDSIDRGLALLKALREIGFGVFQIAAAQQPAQAAPGCTCPSGDASLRWPCPTHPPGDDAAGGGHG